ncbi:MAG: UvrD-helicase domain-containing protein [Nitrospirota bacterium]
MTENYLDITKSVMISSPAGSGKTEKLARRYISLLRDGSDVERILAITFTDKAAAEMKERVLNILRKEDPLLFEKVRLRMPRMRISTIHSFCLKLLKRFCLDLDIDPSIRVMDSFNAGILWSEAVYESLLEDGRNGGRLFYELIRGLGIKGWNRLYRLLEDLHSKRPLLEFGLINDRIKFGDEGPDAITSSEISGISHQASGSDPEISRLEKMLDLYEKCLRRYNRKKLLKHLIDYNDIELMAYDSISKNPEWQNVLYSFDEHTDHILVDEFQDTSSLQWKIIDKLTEEWRSGIGSKRDTGIKPTIFFVGDDKQSIYSFRGANVGIFRNARERLYKWLGDEYHFIEAKENYRSLPAIVNFVNSLFEKLMPRGLCEDSKIGYAPFEATRQGDGRVDLKVIRSIGNMKENRKAEASLAAQTITKLRGKYMLHEDGSTRPCGYGDMAILLRSRTHLSTFEDALRNKDIPFVVVKGIGFYNAPEVAIMKSILFFLIDPSDDYSLVNILRSPLFSLDYRSVLSLIRAGAFFEGENMRAYSKDKKPSSFIYPVLKKISADGATPGPAQGRLWDEKNRDLDIDKVKSIGGSISSWLEMSGETSYSIILETILNKTGAWQFFHERQRHLNVKKFIRLIEEFEANGLSGLEIRDKVIKSEGSDEPKANVNTEGMDAVRILTIHAAKGLQFPMVFVPFLDDENKAKASGSIVLEEEGENIIVAYEDDSGIRKDLPVFKKHKDRVLDEEKRLFYVAATRAMDYLCMSGVIKDKPSGRLGDLYEVYGLDTEKGESKQALPFSFEVFGNESPEISGAITANTPIDKHITGSRAACPAKPFFYQDLPQFIDPIFKDYRPSAFWLDVTEEIDSVRKKHGEGWVILGRAFHRLFEGISKSVIDMKNLETKIIEILRNETASDRDVLTMRDTVLPVMERLDRSGLLNEIILPHEGSFVELPFILQRGKRVYKGRIDRVVIRDGIANIYDYKTYPLQAAEIPGLIRRYSFQMEIYKEAVERLFRVSTIAYLFLTHEPELIRIN